MLEIEISTLFKLFFTICGGLLSLHRIRSTILLKKVFRDIKELRAVLSEQKGICKERGGRCSYGRPEETEDNK